MTNEETADARSNDDDAHAGEGFWTRCRRCRRNWLMLERVPRPVRCSVGTRRRVFASITCAIDVSQLASSLAFLRSFAPSCASFGERRASAARARIPLQTAPRRNASAVVVTCARLHGAEWEDRTGRPLVAPSRRRARAGLAGPRYLRDAISETDDGSAIAREEAVFTGRARCGAPWPRNNFPRGAARLTTTALCALRLGARGRGRRVRFARESGARRARCRRRRRRGRRRWTSSLHREPAGLSARVGMFSTPRRVVAKFSIAPTVLTRHARRSLCFSARESSSFLDSTYFARARRARLSTRRRASLDRARRRSPSPRRLRFPLTNREHSPTRPVASRLFPPRVSRAAQSRC